MIGLRIVAGSRTHAALLAALHKAAFEDAWSAVSIAGLLDHPGSFVLVAEGTAPGAAGARRGQAPLGFVLCRVAGDECEVLTIAVIPPARRRGAAKALLDGALARAAAAGAASVYLEVATDNHAAQALYRGHGFITIGQRPAYYPSSRGEQAKDALVLRRAISQVIL